MKLSFSLSSKPSSSRSRNPTSNPPQSINPSRYRNQEDVLHDEAKPRFVTVFDPSENHSSDSNLKYVVSPIPNYDRCSHKKMKNLPLPTAADDPPPESRFVLDTSGNGFDSETNRYGLLLRSNGTEAKSLERDAIMSETTKGTTKRWFQEETKDLPDEELPDVPVEGFGAAIIVGYGWSKGKAIGRDCKEDVKVSERKWRAGTEGLGYVPHAPNPGKKTQKKEIATLLKSINGKTDDTVDKDDRKSESRERETSSNDRRRENRGREEKRRNHNVTTTAEKSPVWWLRNHIKVRIISKKFGGKLYLKKGEVVDVVSHTTCDIRMDDSRDLVQGVDQEILETAIPKRGGSVLVLYGKHKGVFGSLVEKDSEKETCLVRDADSHALINVRLEQIAEYVGDPSYLGY